MYRETTFEGSVIWDLKKKFVFFKKMEKIIFDSDTIVIFGRNIAYDITQKTVKIHNIYYFFGLL